jgi:hypothetical protein
MLDSVLGDLTAVAVGAGCDGLVPGASCTFVLSRLVLASDPDPLVNEVTVVYHPVGFAREVSASDDHAVDGE